VDDTSNVTPETRAAEAAAPEAAALAAAPAEETAPPSAAVAVVSSSTPLSRLRAARLTGPVLSGLLAFAGYLTVLVTVYGLPLASHLSIPNLRQYWTDVQFYAWSLAWWPYALSRGLNPLFSAQIGAPHGYDLAWASTAPAVSVAMWPVTALFGVLVSYNVMLLLVPPFSAWAAFLAARRLTGRFWASLLAGAVYGLCPYELVHSWQGQPNLTVIALFPLMVYLVLRWWDGSLGPRGFVIGLGLLMTVQFYTFNEAFAEMTVVWAGGLLIGLAVAGRAARRKVARLAGLAGIGYAGSLVLSAPYLVYSLQHYQGALTRQYPAFSLPLIRLIVPESAPGSVLPALVRYSGHLGRGGIDDYVGFPLIAVLLVLAGLAWRNRVTRLLLLGFVFVIALAAGPSLVVTSVRHTYPLPWAALWRLPIARSAEPSRFIVFAVLVLALALALWLAAPPASRLRGAARWGLGLLAVAAIIADTPTSYQPATLLPSGFHPPATMHPAAQLPPFLTDGLYRRYLHPGEIVAVVTYRGNAGMLFQADAGFYFRIAGGYINASLTPVNAVPHPVAGLARPSRAAVQIFDRYARASGLGAIIVEQAWAEPWMDLGKIGMHGFSVGGVTIYPVAPWLASQAKAQAAAVDQASATLDPWTVNR
jgi:hypothetical protein